MRTFQFDLKETIVWKAPKKSVKRCAFCKLNETREESEWKKNSS